MTHRRTEHLEEWAALVGEHVPEDAEPFDRRRHTWCVESEDCC